jgi:hypothetical protein
MAAQSSSRTITRQWMLPPLILHPFSDASGPGRLVESSRASLMLQGLLPSGELSVEELERRLLDGRYCELRMLFYVGRDLLRWIEQCQDYVDGHPDLRQRNYKFQTFANLLVNSTPPRVVAKLKQWGVADYRAIFQRALGLNCLLAQAPEREQLAPEFIRNYFRYADNLYLCRQHGTTFEEAPDNEFEFDLFASGEYARMLEREWDDSAEPDVS